MDKNMISIDDLFRQRLGDAEEKERPGAWLHMRELLDEKMPTDVVGGSTNWRRMLGYATGLLLLASASIGGYEILSANRNNVANSNIAAISADNTSATKPKHSAIVAPMNNNTVVSANNNITGDKPQRNSVSDKGNYVANETANSYTAYSNSNKDATPSPVSKTNSGLHTSVTSQPVATVGTHKSTHSKHIQNSSTANHIAVNNPVHKRHSSANNSSVNTTNTLSVAANNTQPNTSVNNNNKRKTTKQTPNTNTVNKNLFLASGNNTGNTNKITGNHLQQATKPVAYQLQKDTIQKLEIVQHYSINTLSRMGSYSIDTVAIAKVPVQRTMPVANTIPTANTGSLTAMNTNKQGLNNSALVPAATLPAQNAENKTEVGLAAHAASHHKGASMNLAAFNDMINNVKTNLGSVRFLPGITGGINGTFFGTHNFAGIELGMTGDLEFSDHWDVLAELKYFNRFSNGVLNDNYTTISNTNAGMVRDSMRHYFNYSSMQSIELPVSIRYRAGNFALFVGGNLVYNFAINAEEIQQPYQVALEGPVTAPKFSSNDFGARFGIGYLFGVGYNITPALQLDMRMVQTLHDNAKGSGAQSISKDFYQTPSLQLSINYRLNNQRRPVK